MAQAVRGIGITIVVIMVILIIMGTCLGGIMQDTDLANPKRSVAQAEQIQADTEQQTKIDEMEMPYIEQERAAESDTKIAEEKVQKMLIETRGEIARQDLEHQQEIKEERQERKLERDHLLKTTLIIGMGAATLCIVFCIGYATIRRINQNMALENRRMELMRSEAERWGNPAYRDKMILDAKQREAQIRSIQLH